jgi:adenine C2-methylase RlmN of 23S rRNA A2503 and tRNA A37
MWEKERYVKLVEQSQLLFMDYPSTISIETLALCNTDCSFCSYSGGRL